MLKSFTRPLSAPGRVSADQVVTAPHRTIRARAFVFLSALLFGVVATACGAPKSELEDSVISGDLSPALSSEAATEYRAIAAANDGKVALSKTSPLLRAELEALLAAAPTQDDPKWSSDPPAWPKAVADLKFTRHFRRVEPPYQLANATFETPEGPVAQAQLTGGYKLLAFWATWCAPCLTELGEFERLSRSIDGKGLRVIAVQTEQRSDELAQKTQIALDRAKVTTLPLWRDASETGVDLMMKNGRTLPLTILIGPDGAEIARLSGLELGPGGKNIWESKDAATFFQKINAAGS